MKKLLVLLPFITLADGCKKSDKDICLEESIPFETVSITEREIIGFFNLQTDDTTAYVTINSQEEFAEHLKFGNTMPTNINFENNTILGGCIYNRNRATVTSQRVDRICEGGTVIYTVKLSRSLGAGGFTSHFVVVPKIRPGTVVMFERVYEN